MHIVTRKHIAEALRNYPDAAGELTAWVAVVKAARWHSFSDVREMFKDADYVDGYVVFNIRANRYRLITVIHYATTRAERETEGHIYIRSLLTHKRYDDRRNWDKRFGKQ